MQPLEITQNAVVTVGFGKDTVDGVAARQVEHVFGNALGFIVQEILGVVTQVFFDVSNIHFRSLSHRIYKAQRPQNKALLIQNMRKISKDNLGTKDKAFLTTKTPRAPSKVKKSFDLKQ